MPSSTRTPTVSTFPARSGTSRARHGSWTGRATACCSRTTPSSGAGCSPVVTATETPIAGRAPAVVAPARGAWTGTKCRDCQCPGRRVAPHRGAWIARRPRPCRSVGVPGQRARPTAFRRLPCGQGDLVAMSLRCSTGPALEFLAPFVHRPSPTGAQPRDARVVARRISAKVWLTSVSATPRRVTNSIFVLRW